MKTYLGDAVMTIPLIEGLVEGGFDVTCITSNPVAELLRLNFSFAHIRYDCNRSPGEVIRSARQLKKLQFDAVLLVNHSFRSAMTARLAGIPVRVGHATEGRSWTLTHRVPYDEHSFEAGVNEMLGGPLGLIPAQRAPTLNVPEAAKAVIQKRFSRPVVGIQPGARKAWKQIPMAALATVASEIQALGYEVALFGGSDETHAGEALQANLSEAVIDLIGKTDIHASAGGLACMKSVLGGDTGLMHIAAAVGTPVVQVFGPTPASKWGHRYGRNRVIEAPGANVGRVVPQILIEAIKGQLEDG